MGISRKQSTSNFPKNEQFLPLDTHMYLCVSGGKKMFVFRRIRRALFSWNTRSEIGPSALLLTTSAYMRLTLSVNSRYSKKKWKKAKPKWRFTRCRFTISLREKCPNTEFFLVRIFPHSDRIWRDTSIFPYSVRMRENTDQKKLRNWTLFTQCMDYAIWTTRLSLLLLLFGIS